MHIYTYIYTYIYHTHTDLSIYLTYMCMHTYMYSNTNMYTIIYTYIHTYIHIYTYQKKNISEKKGREEGKKKLEEGKTNVVQYRVFGGNVGAEREELGHRARQSECTCAHQERLALLPPRLAHRSIPPPVGGMVSLLTALPRPPCRPSFPLSTTLWCWVSPSHPYNAGRAGLGWIR